MRNMRKIFIITLFFAAAASLLTGCLKDKGFEDQEYGINDPDTQPPGVGFPLGSKTNAFGLDVSASTQVINDMVYVNLLSGNAAPSAINVALVDNSTTLIANYNTANELTGTDAILPLPTSIYNFATSLTIPGGSRNVQVPLNVTNTTALDPNRSYAVGISISTVDGGYKIASNLDDLLIIFSIKNRLDGIYEVTGAALRAADPVLTGPVGPIERILSTSGANSVQWEGQVPWANGGGSALPAGYEPNITVDPVTNLITSLTSTAGTTLTGPIVRTDLIGTTHRYDPATKTLYFEFTYGGGPTSRLFTFKARWLRPR
jgi:hypothetical protein